MIQIGINIAVKGAQVSGPPPSSPPVNSTLPVISGTTSVGSVLNTTNGTWTNSPSSFSYQWKRGATNIGTNTTTYTLVQADAAQNITCVVTATNAAGSTNATSNILYIYDLDAQTFITNATISNSTEQQAINNLVIGLKSDSLWTKMLAVYPFVGGTATTCKFNLKNPLDTDAAFRLDFQGGWTFSNDGIQPNGTNTYADTFLAPLTHWTLGSSSISAYSRTNNVDGTGVFYGSRGVDFSSALNPLINVSNVSIFHNQQLPIAPAPPTTTALNFISSRINTTEIIVAYNGSTTNNASNVGNLSPASIYLSARNNNNAVPAVLFSNRQLAFAHIGTGLTQAECTLFYNRIQTFQTALSRNV